MAEGAVLLESGRERQGRAGGARETQRRGIDQAVEIGLLDRGLPVRELGDVLHRSAIGAQLHRPLGCEPLARAFEGHGAGLERQAQGGLGDLDVADCAPIGDLEVAGAVLDVAAEREGDIALTGQARRLEAVVGRHMSAGLVDDLKDLAGVAQGPAIHIDALAGPREPRNLHQALGQAHALDRSGLHGHLIGVAQQSARPPGAMDHRHALVGEDVGAVEGVGQAHLILADRLVLGDPASGHADAEDRLSQPAYGDVVADPVPGIGALLLGP